MTGDGDALAIGGNHFIHAIRRNIDINIVLFNNEIYGLTKGQFSPTSQTGIKTKSNPHGITDSPFIPTKLALGSGATFIARITDTNPKGMQAVFLAAENHRGTSLVEILQNCVIFNDQTFGDVTGKEVKHDMQLYLEHGTPMIYGKDSSKGIVLNGLKLETVTLGENGITEDDLLVHDAHEEDISLHMMIANMTAPEFPVAMGVIRAVKALTFDEGMAAQLEENIKTAKFKTSDELFNSGDTWEVK
jgi:2-oxoglutarate ferredoxin oxidoreductase subunit beta